MHGLAVDSLKPHARDDLSLPRIDDHFLVQHDERSLAIRFDQRTDGLILHPKPAMESFIRLGFEPQATTFFEALLAKHLGYFVTDE